MAVRKVLAHLTKLVADDGLRYLQWGSAVDSAVLLARAVGVSSRSAWHFPGQGYIKQGHVATEVRSGAEHGTRCSSGSNKRHPVDVPQTAAAVPRGEGELCTNQSNHLTWSCLGLYCESMSMMESDHVDHR